MANKTEKGFAADIRWTQDGESHTYTPKDATTVSLSVGRFSVVVQGDLIYITERSRQNYQNYDTILTLSRT